MAEFPHDLREITIEKRDKRENVEKERKRKERERNGEESDDDDEEEEEDGRVGGGPSPHQRFTVMGTRPPTIGGTSGKSPAS